VASTPPLRGGGGHSFSPLATTDGIILSLDRLQGVIEIDAPSPDCTDPRRHPALGARRTARRQVRFNEMEWSLPANRGAEALREIRAFISRREFPLNDCLM
jgi:hypothetical protein